MTPAPTTPFYRRRERFDLPAELVRCREFAPVTRVALPMGSACFPVWLVTRYQEARRVLGNAALYSNSIDRMTQHLTEAFGEQAAARMTELAPGPLVVADPPEHTRLRRVLTPEFTAARMRLLTPRVEQIVAEHLDAMDTRGGPVDLVEAFALPVPLLVICELLGVPYSDRAEFRKRGEAQLDRSLSHEKRAAAAAESRSYMAELVRMKRAEPSTGLLGRLVARHGDELSDDDLIGIGTLLLLAGHETTAGMLALATLLLLEHPDQWSALGEDPAITDRAVEELLRFLSVVPHPTVRTALRDTMIGDQTIAAGDMVLCSIPGANRDPELTPHSDILDISRKPSGHLGFGHGIHHCIGAPLARIEMRVALPELARRFPTLRSAVALDELTFRTDSTVYGVQSLPVVW